MIFTDETDEMGWYDELVMVYVIGFINSRLLGFVIVVLLLCFCLYFVCSSPSVLISSRSKGSDAQAGWMWTNYDCCPSMNSNRLFHSELTWKTQSDRRLFSWGRLYQWTMHFWHQRCSGWHVVMSTASAKVQPNGEKRTTVQLVQLGLNDRSMQGTKWP